LISPFGSAQEEQEKRKTRGSRFNVETDALAYKPDEDEAAKKKRAERFGGVYTPADAALMDMGVYLGGTVEALASVFSLVAAQVNKCCALS
jgi:hypothetical protein